MKRQPHASFRDVMALGHLVKVVGAHSALGAVVGQDAGFQAVWASSFEISAAHCLPDASLLTMTQYLEAAANMQKAVAIPVVADCDSGYGNGLNMAHMVHEYESAGITAVCVEDKLYPKMNSFVGNGQALLDAKEFARKLSIAKDAQQSEQFFVIARTDALVSGHGLEAALERCHLYADAGADAVLVHSKQRTEDEVAELLRRWQARLPVIVVPTTFPAWHCDDARRSGVSVVIYANHGLRAQVQALRATFRNIYDSGHSLGVEREIASIDEIFSLQKLEQWRELE